MMTFFSKANLINSAGIVIGIILYNKFIKAQVDRLI